MIPNVTRPTQGPSEPQGATLPLDEARRVRWPFDGREPMGPMLDRGALTRSKLQWAAEKAKWPEVKRAAQRLLEELERRETSATLASASPPEIPAPVLPSAPLATSALPTPPPPSPAPAVTPTPAESPRVVNASTYLGTQETVHGLFVLAYAGFGAVIAVTTLLPLIWLARGDKLGLAILMLAVNAILSAFLGALIARRRRAARSFRAGRQGEDQMVEQLRVALDSRWTIYRNLQLPDRRDDLDLVLVGPGGVWAVQVKAFSMPLRFHEGRWEYQHGRGWARCTAKHDPAQVSGQAKRLNAYLKENGVERWVERAIALTGRQPYDLVKGSEIPVWMTYNIETRARQLATRHAPQADELTRINELLGRRAVEQRAVEEAKMGRR